MCEGCVEACTGLVTTMFYKQRGKNIRLRIKARSNQITVDEERRHFCYLPREDNTDFISWQECSRRPPAV